MNQFQERKLHHQELHTHTHTPSLMDSKSVSLSVYPRGNWLNAHVKLLLSLFLVLKQEAGKGSGATTTYYAG